MTNKRKMWIVIEMMNMRKIWIVMMRSHRRHQLHFSGDNIVDCRPADILFMLIVYCYSYYNNVVHCRPASNFLKKVI